jgi:hypothetical protein
MLTRVVRQSDPFFTFDIHKKGAMAMNINFEKLQSWRDLSDRQMSLGAIFEAASRTIAELRKIAEAGSAPDGRANFFIAQEWHLKGLRSSADVLHRRILGVIDLVSTMSPTHFPYFRTDLESLRIHLT